MSRQTEHTMTAHTAHHGRQAGVTLVELLVAMLVGLIIMTGVVQVFQGNIINARYQDAMAVMQENGRFAMDLMARELQMAGYTGCLTKAVEVNNQLSGDAATSNFGVKMEQGLIGWEADNTAYQSSSEPFSDYSTGTITTLNASEWSDDAGNNPDFELEAIEGTDMLHIFGGTGAQAQITNVSGNGNDADTVVTIEPKGAISDDQVVMFNDCQQADIVQACNATDQTSQTKIALSGGCTPGNNVTQQMATSVGAGMMVVQANLYYISKRGANAPPSLYRAALDATTANLVGTGEEMVEGIENLQFLYGVDTDNDGSANTYEEATGVSDWTEVVSVRVSLLVQSVDDRYLPEPQTVYFNGANHTATDNRVRQVYTRTINLRNRTY